MSLNNLTPAKGSVKSKKRVARGQGSGYGGTATRGHKGQKSRSGYSKKKNFEGGQMPLQIRVPKRGFKNPNRVSYVALSIARAQEIAQDNKLSELTADKMVELGLLKKTEKVKLLAGGELNGALNVTVHACSKTAKAEIEAKGGTINLV